MHLDALFEHSASSFAAIQPACGLAAVRHTSAAPGALWHLLVLIWQPQAAIMKMCGVFGAAPGSNPS